MPNPLQILTNLFDSSEEREVRLLNQAQKKITSVFASTDRIRSKFQRAQENATAARKALENFREVNANLDVSTVNVANMLAHRRLRNRKWFAITLEAFLGIQAVTLFFETNLHYKLQWLPAIVVGFGMAWFLMTVAIQWRFDGMQPDKNGGRRIVSRFYFILPLLPIALFNGYIILANPTNPANILLTFTLFLSFAVNLAVTSHSSQYVLMQQTHEARKNVTRLQNALEGAIDALDRIRDEVQHVRMTVVGFATEFRDLYEAMVARGERPRIVIPLPYAFVLNRRLWYTDIIPIPQIQITEPTGAVAEFSRFWDAATTVDVPTDHLLGGAQAADASSGTPPEDVNGSPPIDGSYQRSGASDGQSPQEPMDDGMRGNPTSGFGGMQSDNEKFV